MMLLRNWLMLVSSSWSKHLLVIIKLKNLLSTSLAIKLHSVQTFDVDKDS